MEDKVKALEELGRLGKEWIEKFGNPHQTILIDMECIGVSGMEMYLPTVEMEGKDG